jgi:hypothetical protein
MSEAVVTLYAVVFCLSLYVAVASVVAVQWSVDVSY